jgi:hypothetical protein
MADMATTDAPFGLIPWGPMHPDACHFYAIETEPDVALFHGDPAATEGTAIATPHMGYRQSIEVKVGQEASSFAGVIMGLFDEDMLPVASIATTDTGNGTIAGYALVCDDPLQRYIVAEDGDASSIQVAEIGENADLTLTHAGDTDTGRSKCELDSNTTDVTVTLDVKILGVHPEDTISATGAAGNHCRFIVSLNTAVRGQNVVGE